MRAIPVLTLCAALPLALSGVASASDPIGVYALVDKVVVTPSEGPAEFIQIFGAFALAKKQPRDSYTEPQRGYLYLGLEQGKEEECRKQWAEMRRLAGNGEVMAFGSRYAAAPRVRPESEKPEKAEAHATGFGLSKFRSDTKYRPVRGLLSLPRPLRPLGDAKLSEKAGDKKVALVCKNALWKFGEGARYYFEIDGRDGKKEKSAAIEPGKEETTWTPALELEPGIEYTWRVWVKDSDYEGPIASSTFTLAGSVAKSAKG